MPKQESALDPFKFMFQAHPWHGVAPGKRVPETVNAYIEIVPTDAVKYELDKETGHLRVDRPQRFSSMCPSLYGFIPQTFCGDHVADLCAERTGMTDIKGDGDPMDAGGRGGEFSVVVAPGAAGDAGRVWASGFAV